MNPAPSESSESDHCPPSPPAGTETGEYQADGRTEGRSPVMEPFAHRAINRRREKLWNERCEPGHLPCLSLPSAMIGFLLGIGFSVILWTFVRTVATDATDAAQANKETPTPNPVEAWMEDVDENKNPGWSEAGIDPHANPEQAEKLRHETEQRLDPIDDEEEDAPK